MPCFRPTSPRPRRSSSSSLSSSGSLRLSGKPSPSKKPGSTCTGEGKQLLQYQKAQDGSYQAALRRLDALRDNPRRPGPVGRPRKNKAEVVTAATPAAVTTEAQTAVAGEAGLGDWGSAVGGGTDDTLGRRFDRRRRRTSLRKTPAPRRPKRRRTSLRKTPAPRRPKRRPTSLRKTPAPRRPKRRRTSRSIPHRPRP